MNPAYAVLIAFFMGFCAGAFSALYWATRTNKTEPDRTINGKPAWKIGVWVEAPKVEVYVVHEGFGTWHVWSVQPDANNRDVPLRVSKISQDSRDAAESLAFANGVVPTVRTT